MAGDPRVNYVGLPDLEPGRCGFSVDLASPRCEMPAAWHLYGSSPFADVGAGACDEHRDAAAESMTELYGTHPYGPGCYGELSIWLGDHCEPAPSVPSTKEPTE